MKVVFRVSFGALLLAATGCDTGGAVRIPWDSGRGDWMPWVEDLPDAGQGDAALEVPDAVLPDAGDLPAAADEGSSGPRDAVLPGDYLPARSVRFRMAGRDEGDLRVEVVARDFTGVFGIALRVEWDPTLATLVSAAPGTVLDSAGDTVGAAAEVRPGSLAVGIALKTYTDAADWTGDRVVATLRLRPAGAAAIPLSFVLTRSSVVDGGLNRQEVTWLPAVAYP